MAPSGHWGPVYQSLWTHRKTFELAALLGLNETYAAAHLIRLWGWAIDNAPDGDLSKVSDRAIAYGAGWTQEVSLFVAALVRAGFLDDDRTIHNWQQYAGKLIVRREKDALRKHGDREMSNGQAPDVRRTSNGVSGLVRRREEESREEEKRGQKTVTSPQPPPPAEGELPSGAGLSAAPTSPTTEDDARLWATALAAVTDGILPSNAEKVAALEPLGRGPDGGLRLRAPPWADAGRFQGAVRAALVNAGDKAGGKAVIVTT